MQNKNRVSASPDQVRETVERLAQKHGESLGALSRMIGRNDAYLQQFIRRGTPERLAEDDRLKLAQFFRIDERRLGARDPWTPPEELSADRFDREPSAQPALPAN